MKKLTSAERDIRAIAAKRDEALIFGCAPGP